MVGVFRIDLLLIATPHWVWVVDMIALAAGTKKLPLLQRQAQWDRLLGGVFCTGATKIGELYCCC